jgi:outer membrane protein TolC
MGKPTSPKNDKGPYELEALVNLDVPLQRRKARGKIASVEGKLAQIAAKTRFTQDKISIEVENARVGLMAAFDALEQARRSVELGQQMEQFEQFTFERGAGDLLRVNIRELQTFDAQVVLIDSELRYFGGGGAYRAALASDVPADFEAGDLSPASDHSVP